MAPITGKLASESKEFIEQMRHKMPTNSRGYAEFIKIWRFKCSERVADPLQNVRQRISGIMQYTDSRVQEMYSELCSYIFAVSFTFFAGDE